MTMSEDDFLLTLNQ